MEISHHVLKEAVRMRPADARLLRFISPEDLASAHMIRAMAAVKDAGRREALVSAAAALIDELEGDIDDALAARAIQETANAILKIREVQ